MDEPNWAVKSVEPQDDYSLLLTFADGQKRRYDARPLLEYELFAPLRQLPLFKRAHIEFDTVAWDGGLDIAPETLYGNSVPVSTTA